MSGRALIVIMVLALSGSAAAAQRIDAGVPWAGLTSVAEGVNSRTATLQTERFEIQREGIGRKRPSWLIPLVGAGVGVAAGIAYGVHLQPEDPLGPPAFLFTVPAGALVGGLLGGLIEWALPNP